MPTDGRPPGPTTQGGWANLRITVRASGVGCQHRTVGQLDEAVQAHQAALAGLTSVQERAQREIAAARARVDRTRGVLAEAIAAAALAGARQVDIIKVTGYSREQVRGRSCGARG